MKPTGRDDGFTLIELLIVVAIIGILAAVAVPGMLNSIDRSKQKRTMADMRSIATAFEQYSIDHNFYPLQPTQADLSGAVLNAVVPSYTARLPERDGWSRTYQYGTTSNGVDYTVRSLAKDGVKNGVAGPTGDFNCDIVLQNGQFIAWPDGAQT